MKKHRIVVTSIRKFLLYNLLLAIACILSILIVIGYFTSNKEITASLYELLTFQAGNYAVLVSSNTNQALKTSPHDFDQLRERLKQYIKEHHAYCGSPNFYNSFIVQIWDASTHELILSSRPEIPLTLSNTDDAFASIVIAGQTWRTFQLTIPEQNRIIMTAYDEQLKKQLLVSTTKNDLMILIIVLPLSALLIWLIVGKGLSSLIKVTNAVHNRVPSYLKPVNIRSVPEEIKPLIDEINQLLNRLEQALEREKRFASDAAHELKTPLAALKTQLQVALMSSDKASLNQALINLLSGVDRSSHLVTQLLTMSRLVPEANLYNDVGEIHLGKLSEEIIAQQAHLAIEKNIDLELVCEPGDLLIKGNITAISILIRNLIDNAINYISEGNEIKCSVRKVRNHIILTIADNGPGIPENLRKRVFERFYRVLGNDTQGSGLGLSIVAQIAQLHHAEVKLKTPNVGTGLIVEVVFLSTSKTE